MGKIDKMSQKIATISLLLLLCKTPHKDIIEHGPEHEEHEPEHGQGQEAEPPAQDRQETRLSRAATPSSWKTNTLCCGWLGLQRHIQVVCDCLGEIFLTPPLHHFYCDILHLIPPVHPSHPRYSLLNC